ncbi:MAG: M23 family metallopeptidase, partial [Acidobacteriota bacterium]|nr:M23 family metallopeptidase [Acidobacteriota bacterium]
MGRKVYTLFILPHAHARFRKVHLSRNFLVVSVVLVFGIMVAGLLSPHLLFRLQIQSEKMAVLEDENQRLVDEKEQFETALADLGVRLNDFEDEASRLAAALGLEEPSSLEPAAGGGGEAGMQPAGDVQGMLDEEMTAVGKRAENLGRSLEAFSDAWLERERLLASTPSIMPVRGWFSDGYGWRKNPVSGNREFHKGIDVVAPAGAVIRATADGVVTASGRVGGYGKKVDLYHGFGYKTRYGHMSEIFVKPGQKVRRGDALGRVGSTGRSTGPHLHYEVFKEGRRVNPW